MKRLVLLAVLGLAGCASRPEGVRVQAPAAPDVRVANLALGPSARHLWAATTEWNYRSSWPSVESGYWFDDLSSYADIQLDEQFDYSRFNAFYRSAESVRTGVRVR